eukprot:scaffold5208_cov154-Isochrysis_galbana.AAC.3
MACGVEPSACFCTNFSRKALAWRLRTRHGTTQRSHEEAGRGTPQRKAGSPLAEQQQRRGTTAPARTESSSTRRSVCADVTEHSLERAPTGIRRTRRLAGRTPRTSSVADRPGSSRTARPSSSSH